MRIVVQDPEFTPELELALKRAIAISLTRANMGVIKNGVVLIDR